MRDFFARSAERIDALVLRQRVLIFCAVACIVIFAAETIFMGPLRLKQRRVMAEMATEQKDLATLHGDIQRLLQGNAVDPDAANRRREATLQQDLKQLSALPGIGAALAERIVAKLRRKMAKFALMIARDVPPEREAERGVMNDAYEALLTLGHTAPEARQKIEHIASAGKRFKSVEEVLEEIYRSQQK